MRVIDRVAEDGLDPDDYHRAPLTDLVEVSQDEDVLLTDAFITLSDHFVRGRVHPESLIPDWCIPPK